MAASDIVLYLFIAVGLIKLAVIGYAAAKGATDEGGPVGGWGTRGD